MRRPTFATLGAALFCILLTHSLLVLGADKTYTRGKLAEVSTTDMSFPLTMESPGRERITLPMGVLHQFNIQADDVLYVATCYSREKRGFASDWVVNDAVEFRINKGVLYLKRPSGKELKLTFLFKARGTIDPVATSAKQQVPECR
ncbi:MAG TPA: hypothetical protein VF311_12295 [Terriglobales bacterium]